jgi:hypothetical protein
VNPKHLKGKKPAFGTNIDGKTTFATTMKSRKIIERGTTR